ncbi:MAG: CBS domain-containing protein, partial [Kiritimatiellales bacterium]|nr:CBS domain-containing protein [Kiritimatiellales bacterium]
MKANLENTTVRDISYLINTACLRADSETSLEKLAGMLCTSDRYKIYLESKNGTLCGVIQAKQIAMKILELSRSKSEQQEMLPAITYVLNAHTATELADPAVTVQSTALLKDVLELMNRNEIREIAVVDEHGVLVGTLEARNILAHYL